MPIIQRLIQPTAISRDEVSSEEGIGDNELCCVTNNSLSQVMRQLSDLSRHAGDLFVELINEVKDIRKRTNRLRHRLDNISNVTSKLDPQNDPVLISDSDMFKSNISAHQQLITKESLPNCLAEVFMKISPPPNLDLWTRPGEESRLKLYTDPTFFFQLWAQNTKKEIAELKSERKKKKKIKSEEKKQIRQPSSTAQKYEKYKHGKDIAGIEDELKVGSDNYIAPPRQYSNTSANQKFSNYDYSDSIAQNGYDRNDYYQDYKTNGSHQLTREKSSSQTSLPPPPPLPPHLNFVTQQSVGDQNFPPPPGLSPDTPPPPPPPPTAVVSSPPQSYTQYTTPPPTTAPPPPPPPPPPGGAPVAPCPPPVPTSAPVPPPPPPPPPGGGAPPPPPPPPPGGAGPPRAPPPPSGPPPPSSGAPSTGITVNDLKNAGLKPMKDRKMPAPVQNDPHSDLLQAIRKGVMLKKRRHEEEDKNKKTVVPTTDVSSLLAQKIGALYAKNHDEDSDSNSSWGED